MNVAISKIKDDIQVVLLLYKHFALRLYIYLKYFMVD